jgi:phosphohistidine phosphatase
VLSLGPHASSERIALVGHEPNLSEVASYLLTGTGRHGVDLELKKGGVACVGVDGVPGPGTAWLRWLATPRMLRSM